MYGSGIRYRIGPPVVRNMRAVQKTGSCGTRRIFRGSRCKKTGFSGTGVIFGTGNPLLWYGADIRCAEQPSVVRDAFSGAPGTQQPPPAPSGALKIGLLLVQKADSCVWRQELLCGPEDS